MPLSKAKGNMYDWVTHMHTHIRGACPHRCAYCYVKSGTAGRMGHYAGPLRLEPKELEVRYGRGKTVFIEHLNDLFCKDVPQEWIFEILEHVGFWPGSRYVFQTKNPARLLDFLAHTPQDCMVGCTIETNRDMPATFSAAPRPASRAAAMRQLVNVRDTFLTIEPIVAFDHDALAEMVIGIRPRFVNIGADSKGHGLPEPTRDEVLRLYATLVAAGIEVRRKTNLARLVG